MTPATTPFWWEDSPPAAMSTDDLPGRADAVVIGSGYTGLQAALAIARGGRSVVVLEAGVPGQGCSTRNGGQISTSIKPGLAKLSRAHGAETARGILAEGVASRAYVEDFVRSEGIECAFAACGRFHAAATPAAYAALSRVADGRDVTLVPRDRQREELGTDAYHGGAVFHRHASLDPGRYHAGLMARVLEAGARIFPDTPALSLDAEGSDKTVRTPRGTIATRDVVLATNGYSGALSPWHRRRIIPVGSYIIATEPLPRDLIARLFPTMRIASDSRRVVYYFRPSPDGRRVLFGGRTSAAETGARVAAARLRTAMCALFPELGEARITHAWSGYVGYTFDSLSHTDSRDRIHHAMGYCGSGVGMASYLGWKAGLRVLGLPGGDTALMRPAFPTRPLYEGDPWFLPAAVTTYRMLDRLGL
ncbi:MAG: FAD-binding oxidoreductase [Jannaschia sp.]